MKRIVFTLSIVLSIMVTLPAMAWEMKKIECKKPEARKLADHVYEMLMKDLDVETYRKVIPLMEKATAIEPDNDQLWVELSGDYWEYADKLPRESKTEKEKRIALNEKGMAAAEKALAIKESAGGHFWYACNLASRGEMKGIMRSLHIFPEMRKHIEASQKIDPNYQVGGAARFWSEVIARVPDAAIRAVGMDKDEPMNDIKTQMKREPTFLNNFIFYARYLVRLDRNEEAIKTLDYILRADPKNTPNPAWVSQNVSTQEDARELWKEITGKPYPNR